MVLGGGGGWGGGVGFWPHLNAESGKPSYTSQQPRAKVRVQDPLSVARELHAQPQIGQMGFTCLKGGS